MRSNLIVILVLIITALSLFTLYSATHNMPAREGSVFGRQLIWIICGWLIFFIFSRIYYRRLIGFIYPFYGLLIFFLILVLIIGGARMGAQRWIKLWWFNFQPSEFAKLAIILILSFYYSSKGLYDIALNTRRLSFLKGLVFPFLIILVPFGLILKQPDLGTGLMLSFIFLGMVYYSGVKVRYIVLVLFLGAFMTPWLWNFLKDYQKDRILVFLNPSHDPLGAGYTIIQSKIAIGSGKFFGRGWLSGTQGQLNFLPESHTDFIFCIFAEETGFLGCILLLSLYYFIVRQALKISENADDNFGKLFSFGIALMFSMQVYINISMTLGISPVVGLPLPLMSYGGSSILVTFASLGILKSIERGKH